MATEIRKVLLSLRIGDIVQGSVALFESRNEFLQRRAR